MTMLKMKPARGEKQHGGNGGREERGIVKSQFLTLSLLPLFRLSPLLASRLLLLILNTYISVFLVPRTLLGAVLGNTLSPQEERAARHRAWGRQLCPEKTACAVSFYIYQSSDTKIRASQGITSCRPRTLCTLHSAYVIIQPRPPCLLLRLNKDMTQDMILHYTVFIIFFLNIIIQHDTCLKRIRHQQGKNLRRFS